MTAEVKRRTSMWIWVSLAAAVFLGANAHLLYVAVNSQPQCLKHSKERGDRPGEFRAASPSC
ncbi:MAG TPA: hypothetical protein DCW88_12465 [Agrobacterium sp.]|nr:hypothetical protein CFBP6625_27580 [Agrobacterium tumefaciens]RAL97237.1 hypothetical protein DOU54_13135 [Agrobacterium sp. MS2]HAU76305.1 hypothetical protein [Agrobacterium sp.]